MLSLALILTTLSIGAPIVTNTPIVQQDLYLASEYNWGAIPDTTPLDCPDGPQVDIGLIGQATGDEGPMSLSATWAEAVVGSCTIYIAPRIWRWRHQMPFLFCLMITHEYGHLVGLPDILNSPIMDTLLNKDRDPLCHSAGP